MRVALRCFAALLALLAAGRAYQAITWKLEARRSPEPGRLIDTGTARLQIHCIGTGSPTVILESGLGDTLTQWRIRGAVPPDQ